MLNYIWGGMIVISFISAVFTGRIDQMTAGAIEGAASAVETCIGLLGSMCLWTGIAKIAENSGLINVFAKLLRPLTKIIFPKLKSDSAAMRAIVMNMVANLLGMGNAATPLGISAMKELDKINKGGSTASNEMCMFVVINTASIQLIPSTVISLRQMYGSASPAEIVVPVWICSVCAVTVGIVAAKIFQKRVRV
ncbi:MAG: nucleoside recognition protein [Clostridia bacterium]|nr:nucleoside recognition protein [Clostridia bacterium]